MPLHLVSSSSNPMTVTNPQHRLVIGTAGHIDHGKSTLVRVLTGTDPDRLPEEQARGMTIDLGFAFWEHGIAFVDVPGHERFVKNMVAGATGIDAALLVVAADDGVMPQTREHYAILSLLGVHRGIVAITKTSLADPVWLEMVIDDVRTMLARGTLSDASILSVDSLTQQGIPELRIALQQLAESIPAKSSSVAFSLAVDRVFTKPGFGAVVTGTVSGGELKVGDTIEIQPKNLTVRVRGIQSQNIARERVGSGERAAINITGIDRDSVERGDRLCEPGVFTATTEIDVQVSAMGDEPIKHRSRVRFHSGTAEIIGRLDFLNQTFLQPGESTFARFQAETPFVTQFHERFVIRRYSPAGTIGGGIVLNPNPLHRLRSSENIEWLPLRLPTLKQSQYLQAAVAETEPSAATIARLSIALSLPKAVLLQHIIQAKIENVLLEGETRVLRV
ncbi:MAG: selenocysteine-specific translation elongation factor [bacterium]|nr:selenocysteine-specific translation elongation factor [bacterium]